MKKIIVMLIFVALFAPFFAFAETYYVSPTGSATWAQCTNINTPCGGKTAVENAVAGDVVYFRGGTYDPTADPITLWTTTPDSLKYETLPWNPRNSGADGNPITFQAYPGETPVILDNIYSGAFGAVGKDYIIWDGFTATIVNLPNNVITLALFLDTNNCAIRNSNLTGVAKGDTKNSALIRTERSRYIVIENNKLHDMTNGINSTGILNFNSRDMTIRNNDIYNNFLGIWDKDSEQNNIYYNNHIWGGNDSSTLCSVGIQINNESDEFSGPTSGIRGYQNIIRNCNVGVFIFDSALVNDASIYNNVIYTTSSSAEVGVYASDLSRDANVYDNTIYGYLFPLRYFSGTPLPSYSNYNLFYNSSGLIWNLSWTTNYRSLDLWGSATGGFDANSIISDPLFVNAGGANPDDYMLSSGSPARGAGRNGKDIGAFPDGSLITIGVIKPSPPIDLSVQTGS